MITDKEYFRQIGREVGKLLADAIKAPEEGHVFFGNQWTSGNENTDIPNPADKDFQGRDQSGRTVIRGGNLTKEEADIMELSKNGMVLTSNVDKNALDTFKKNGLVRFERKVFQSSPSVFSLTLSGLGIKEQYFRVKERISRGL